MNTLKIQNCYSWLVTKDRELLRTLWRALRFREKNYFHSRLYKQKLWDGYTDFFKLESGRFLTGLLPEVLVALKHLEASYEVKDERQLVEFRIPEIKQDILPGFTLHDYQVDLTNQAIKHRRGIIGAKTGAGKTFVLVCILKALPQNCPTLILANRKSLVEQNYQEIKKFGFQNVGRLYDKYKEPNMFTCATVQSLHKIENILPKVQALIVDEVHENMSKRPKKFFNKMKSCSVRIALSATPFKFSEKEPCQKYAVKGYFGPLFKAKSTTDAFSTVALQKRKILSSSHCHFYPITKPQIPYDIYLDAVTRGIAENWYFHEIICRLVKKLQGRTLVFVDRLAHGDTLHELIPNSSWIQGKDTIETRQAVIEQLKHAKEKFVAIATQQIFNAGVNFKAHNVINAAGGTADHQIAQRIGRGLRPADDKEILDYYDFIFKINDYLEDHSWNRIKILKKEGHEVTVHDEVDF